MMSDMNSIDEKEGVIIDTAKVQRIFSQIECEYFNGSDIYDSISFASFSNACSGIKDDDSLCKICSKHVYHMEKIKAVKSVFHKTCFFCKECKKQLSIDSYSSHEGEVYCTPHFKQLFQPKAKFDCEEPIPRRQRKYELIISENTPQELPPDVIRYNSKVDDEFDSLQLDLINIRNRFELGTNSNNNHNHLSVSDINLLNRSEIVQRRMQKYESGTSAEEDVSSSSDDEKENGIKKESIDPEKAVFGGIASTLKSQWEQGKINSTKESHEEDTKEELTKLRQRMCLGRSESMRQVYERACRESKSDVKSENAILVDSTLKTESIKEKFEKGNVENETEEQRMERLKKERDEELHLFAESETAAKEARNKFKQIDASAAKGAVSPPVQHNSFNFTNGHVKSRQVQITTDVIKCGDPIEKDDIVIDPAQLQERFAYFENYKETPKDAPKRFQITPTRELIGVVENNPDIHRDPNVIRSCDAVEDIPKVDTAKKMLDKFKELENRKENLSNGPKPVRRITPPREYTTNNDNHEESPERDPTIVRSSTKSDMIEVEPEKARSLKAKFENWSLEVDRENKRNNGFDNEDEYIPNIDTTKNLRAKFEAIKEDNNRSTDKPKAKVNRFVYEMVANAASDLCSVCGTRLYPMEKMEFSGIKLHKNCFRCVHCCSSLRLDNYTTTAGKMYCIPHFKQLFMAKGNYDEGFGREQHKDKWSHKSISNNYVNNNNNNNNTNNDNNNNDDHVSIRKNSISDDNQDDNNENNSHFESDLNYENYNASDLENDNTNDSNLENINETSNVLPKTLHYSEEFNNDLQ